MDKKIAVLLVDDHTLFRKGLRLLIEEEQDMSVVGEAVDGQRAIESVRELSPDIVVMDITMPNLNGIEATRNIISESPAAKVMALSIHSGKRFVEDMLRAGAVGYLLKESAPEDLVKGIRTIVGGEIYLSPSITGIVVSQYMNALSQNRAEDEWAALTIREKEFVQLLLDGAEEEKITSVLQLSPEMVTSTRLRIMEKIGVNTMDELVEHARAGRYFSREGLVQEENDHVKSPPQNTIPIITTKLYPPAVDESHVHRQRLLEQMTQSRQQPLILVSAPAGYGKSVLTSCWLKESDWPGAWLSLDEDDNDLRTFLIYFLSAIQNTMPGALPKTGELLNAAVLPPLAVMAATLTNELDQIEDDFILVLDDFHVIQEKSIHDLITSLLRHPPLAMHLVVVARQDPFLPISTLRAENQLCEIRSQDLCFAADETTLYLKHTLNKEIDQTTAALWTERTEGWVTGLRLAALAMIGREDLEADIPGLPEDSHRVREYLFNEVLSQQSPIIRNYLLATSILNRFCAPLCEAVCLEAATPGSRKINGWEFVARLNSDNMFIIPLDTDNHWFRYHHLFQKLLKHQLGRYHSAQEIAELHSRASRWFEAQGLVKEAISHALAAGDVVRAAESLEANRDEEFLADRWFVVERWLAMLPADIKQERPKLLLTEAWICYLQHLLARIPMLLDRAESLLRSQTAEPMALAEIAFFRGYIAYFKGEAEQSLKYLENAVSTLAGTKSPILGETELVLGLARCMNGNKDLAVQALEGRINEVHSSEGQLISRLIASLAFIYLICGDLQRARVEAHRLQIVAKKFRMPLTQAWSSYMWACSLLQAGELKSAMGHFAHVYEQRYVLEPVAALDGLVGLALTQQLMRLDNEAKETAGRLAQFAQELNEPQYWSMVHSCYARIALLRGDLKRAVERARMISDKPAPANLFMWLESPPITQARILIASGSEESLESATGLLREIRQVSEACRFTGQTIEVAVLQALAMDKLGRPEEALKALEEAVALSGTYGWIRPFLEAGTPLVGLLKRLIRKNVAVDFIGKLLAAFRDREQSLAPHASDGVRVPAPSLQRQPLVGSLTDRELEVLELAAQRFSNKEIAEKLFISIETVKSHLKSVYQTLNAGNRRQAVTIARSMGILDSH